MIGFSNDDPFGIKEHMLLWIRQMSYTVNTDIQAGDVVYYWWWYELYSAKVVAVGDVKSILNGRKIALGEVPQEMENLPHVEIKKNGIMQIELRFKVFKDFSLAREMFFKTCPTSSNISNNKHLNETITKAIIKFENDNRTTIS